jgi:hypothetical protein
MVKLFPKLKVIYKFIQYFWENELKDIIYYAPTICVIFQQALDFQWQNQAYVEIKLNCQQRIKFSLSF